MARTTNRLSARTAATLTKPGRHADGDGLYLSISPDGSRRRWVFLFRWREAGETGAGKLREMGLGSASSVSLARARELATAARVHLAAGRNPLTARIAEPEIRTPTFAEMADEVLASIETGWRNPKHREQWRMTLTRYCEPIRPLRVDAITTEHVLSVLKPLWTKVPETASRLRGRIEKVLDAARVKGHRTAENPARWRGHLDHLLPKRQKLTRGHHKALPYEKVPDLMTRLRRSGSISALCLEFTILTAARSGEAMGARWSEFDLERGIWTVPRERMKAGREHRVPLSTRAQEIVAGLAVARTGDLVFPGAKADRPLSSMALEMVLRRMKVDATVHGFRSSFRDWAAEMTSTPREIAEAALAHTLENKVEAAYRRTDLFMKRARLMEDWSSYMYNTSF
ncbi:tyrosine-type recombinase/integrase [Methylobacterium isbiliense]|jgi:integrase|uniref:Prophage integrase IntA n=1 Tax=Methylobacterium isbiliense TaxID=315478 RepID=A0ABQ4SK94_9HYPH|nr:site-specific integrase [Methylobacterium isbiliense]MDN3624483.1 tyrosine-type recombinase/integrase [Methylobacterium isbiliense]GJE02163.1 Prophage integrase IntA [Methylobacterium isbiliense]